MKALPKCVETLQRDRAMPKDTGELIFKKSINLYCQPIFSYISSFVIAPYAPFSQSLSHIQARTQDFQKGGSKQLIELGHAYIAICN